MSDRTDFENVRKMIGRNSRLKPYWGQFPTRLARWYIHHICVGIRTLVDTDKRSNSLYGLMTDMLDNDMARKTMSPTKNRIYPSEIKRDRASLLTVSKRIKHFVDTEVAHTDHKGYQLPVRPKWKEIKDSLNTSERLLKKYWLFVLGGSLLNVEPVNTLDWTQQFTFAWYTPPPNANRLSRKKSKKAIIGRH